MLYICYIGLYTAKHTDNSVKFRVVNIVLKIDFSLFKFEWSKQQFFWCDFIETFKRKSFEFCPKLSSPFSSSICKSPYSSIVEYQQSLDIKVHIKQFRFSTKHGRTWHFVQIVVVKFWWQWRHRPRVWSLAGQWAKQSCRTSPTGIATIFCLLEGCGGELMPDPDGRPLLLEAFTNVSEEASLPWKQSKVYFRFYDRFFRALMIYSSECTSRRKTT